MYAIPTHRFFILLALCSVVQFMILLSVRIIVVFFLRFIWVLVLPIVI